MKSPTSAAPTLSQADPQPSAAIHSEPQNEKDRDLYRRIVSQIEVGQLEAALRIANSKGASDLLISNACGVCLLRLGRYSQAVHAYRPLVMTPDGFALRNDVPEVMKVNFAAALILEGNSAGGIDILRQLNPKAPSVQRLKHALRDWGRRLGIWKRLMWRLGIGPRRTVVLEGFDGDLS